jgi:hypothetical protein
MADLLTHVLVVYCLLTVGSWRFDRLTDRCIAVGMGGAVVPDLVKLDLLVSSYRIEQVVGFPVTYAHFATLGGVLLTAGVITVLFEREAWRRTYVFLVVGGVTSLVVDGLRVRADGHASAWLFPFLPSFRPPTPSLYVTSDPRILVVALCVSAAVMVVDWRFDPQL